MKSNNLFEFRLVSKLFNEVTTQVCRRRNTELNYHRLCNGECDNLFEVYQNSVKVPWSSLSIGPDDHLYRRSLGVGPVIAKLVLPTLGSGVLKLTLRIPYNMVIQCAQFTSFLQTLVIELAPFPGGSFDYSGDFCTDFRHLKHFKLRLQAG